MTYCPKCGTANRDGSRFCNQCGELLGTEKQVKCPQCGTLNPGQNLLCTECGAGLEPPSDSAPNPGGLSLSTEADAESESDEGPVPSSESGEEMPGWLRDLGATSSPDEQPLPDSMDEPAEIPAWLRDLRASIPSESPPGMEDKGEEEADTEPSVERPPAPGQKRAAPSASEIREREDRPTEAVEPAVPFPEDEEEPDWLADLRSSALEDFPTPDLPDVEDEETPDWLARLQPTETDIPQEGIPPAPDVAPGVAPSTDDQAGSDWLDMGSLTEAAEDLEPELPAFDAGDEDSLDWLAELIPPAVETGARAAASTAEPDEGDAPDWLGELDSSPQEPKEEPEPRPSEAKATDIPDWFMEPQTLEVEEELDRETSISEPEQSPDWLEEAQAPVPEAEPEVEPEWEEALPAGEAEDTGGPDQPDSLLGPAVAIAAALSEPSEDEDLEEKADQYFPFPPSSIEAEEEFELLDEAGEEAELSEWLAELRPPISEIEPEATTPVTEDQPEEIEDQPVEMAEGIEPDLAPAAPDEELPGAEVPAWLAEMQPEGLEEALPELEEGAVEIEPADWIVPSEPTAEEGELERADIPAWLLALKPPELREQGEPSEPAPSLEGLDTDTGLLSGLQGTLPVEMIIAQPRAVTTARAVEGSIAETDHSRLFREIVGRVPEAAPRQIVQAPARQPKLLPRWILYLALIVVVALPLFLQEPLFIRTIEPAQATTDLYTVIDGLDSNAAVLVAFDYDPTTSGEMEVISQALVGHLMDRGAKVIAMSLLPAGPATAQPLLKGLAAERPDYADSYGQRYVNLGYLPGQATAVRLVSLSPEQAFASDHQGTPLADLPVMEGLTSAEDFDLILELAAKQESVRWWIEQASMPYGVGLGAGVSAPVAPLAQPYYETDPRQLVGLIGGVAGAVTYEALQTEQGSPAQSTVSRLDSQMAGQLLLVLVLLVGNGIFLVQRGARR